MGKSSLINTLAGRRKLAKVSGTPGKTQLLNFFWAESSWYLVDLPGYGYAKVSKTKRASWEKMIREYLVKRENLQCIFLLIDGSIPPQQIDLEFANWLGECMVPFVIVYTKCDKVPKTKRAALRDNFRKAMLETWEEMPQEFTTSSSSKAGKEELLDFIRLLVKQSQAPS